MFNIDQLEMMWNRGTQLTWSTNSQRFKAYHVKQGYIISVELGVAQQAENERSI
jgi:hypothetical protein